MLKKMSTSTYGIFGATKNRRFCNMILTYSQLLSAKIKNLISIVRVTMQTNADTIKQQATLRSQIPSVSDPLLKLKVTK